MSSRRGCKGLSPISSRRAPAWSEVCAGVTSTDSSSPSVSTKRWRFRPLTCLLLSYPLIPPDAAMVLTRWLSMIAAEGSAWRPARRRTAQRLVNALPHPAPAPLAAWRRGRLPWWIRARQRAPGAARAPDVAEGMHEEPQWPGAWPALACWRRHERLEQRPLGVGAVTGREGASIYG